PTIERSHAAQPAVHRLTGAHVDPVDAGARAERDADLPRVLSPDAELALGVATPAPQGSGSSDAARVALSGVGDEPVRVGPHSNGRAPVHSLAGERIVLGELALLVPSP